MKVAKNVRKENGTTINIGSLNIKRALFQKVQHDIGDMSYEEMNQYVKEVLKTGIYIKETLQNGSITHLFQGKDFVIELDSKAKHITNIYHNKEGERPVRKQQENVIKLVDQVNPPKVDALTVEDSFLENTLQTIYDKLLEVEEYSRELSLSLSKIDKGISEVYHKLETTNFNASQGYFFAKKLQILLRKRRWIKTELSKIQSTDADMKQIKGRIQQAEKKMANRQNQYEMYTDGWDFSEVHRLSD